MKYVIALSVLMSAFLLGCEPEPEAVVEKEWSAEQPKLVAYYIGDGEERYRMREEQFYEDGTTEYTGSYDENGLRHGEWKYFYKNGNLWSLGSYDHGNKTGKKEVYWPDGKKRYEGFFNNDEKSGHWIFYDMEGRILEERDFGNEAPEPAP